MTQIIRTICHKLSIPETFDLLSQIDQPNTFENVVSVSGFNATEIALSLSRNTNFWLFDATSKEYRLKTDDELRVDVANSYRDSGLLIEKWQRTYENGQSDWTLSVANPQLQWSGTYDGNTAAGTFQTYFNTHRTSDLPSTYTNTPQWLYDITPKRLISWVQDPTFSSQVGMTFLIGFFQSVISGSVYYDDLPVAPINWITDPDNPDSII